MSKLLQANHGQAAVQQHTAAGSSHKVAVSALCNTAAPIGSHALLDSLRATLPSAPLQPARQSGTASCDAANPGTITLPVQPELSSALCAAVAAIMRQVNLPGVPQMPSAGGMDNQQGNGIDAQVRSNSRAGSLENQQGLARNRHTGASQNQPGAGQDEPGEPQHASQQCQDLDTTHMPAAAQSKVLQQSSASPAGQGSANDAAASRPESCTSQAAEQLMASLSAHSIHSRPAAAATLASVATPPSAATLPSAAASAAGGAHRSSASDASAAGEGKPAIQASCAKARLTSRDALPGLADKSEEWQKQILQAVAALQATVEGQQSLMLQQQQQQQQSQSQQQEHPEQQMCQHALCCDQHSQQQQQQGLQQAHHQMALRNMHMQEEQHQGRSTLQHTGTEDEGQQAGHLDTAHMPAPQGQGHLRAVAQRRFGPCQA